MGQPSATQFNYVLFTRAHSNSDAIRTSIDRSNCGVCAIFVCLVQNPMMSDRTEWRKRRLVHKLADSHFIRRSQLLSEKQWRAHAHENAYTAHFSDSRSVSEHRNIVKIYCDGGDDEQCDGTSSCVRKTRNENERLTWIGIHLSCLAIHTHRVYENVPLQRIYDILCGPRRDWRILSFSI